MLLLLLVGLVTALLLAWTLTSRCQEHRPAAVLLSIMLLINGAEYALDRSVLAPLRATLGLAPWTGWAWAAALLAHAIELVWPAAVLGTALVVFARRRPWLAVAAWVAAVVTYAAIHPVAADQTRFHALAQLLGAVSAAVLAIVAWRKRTAADGESTSRAVVSVILLADLVAFPAAVGLIPSQAWPAPGTLYLLAFAALVLVQGYTILRRHEQRLDALDKASLKAHVIAAAAVRTAERAEEKASEARDLADNIPHLAPPSSRRPASTPTPAGGEAEEPAPASTP